MNGSNAGVTLYQQQTLREVERLLLIFKLTLYVTIIYCIESAICNQYGIYHRVYIR
jgi:hypothetical protein